MLIFYCKTVNFHPLYVIHKLQSSKRSWERERARHSMILMHSIDVVHSSKYSEYLTSKKNCESFNFYFYCRTITERRIPWKGNLCYKWTYFLCVKLPNEKWRKKRFQGLHTFKIHLPFFIHLFFSRYGNSNIYREIIAVISIKLFSLHSVDICLMNFFHINKNSTRYAEAR